MEIKKIPNFPRMFFWEFDFDRIDWQQCRAMVIQRIIERGLSQHHEELINFYGLEQIQYSLKKEVTYLSNRDIEEAVIAFDVREQEMLSYQRKRGRLSLWF